jgi:hypothetical protein
MVPLHVAVSVALSWAWRRYYDSLPGLALLFPTFIFVLSVVVSQLLDY